MSKYADVIIDISHEKVDRVFQYRIPEELLEQVRPGVQVTIPFGKGGNLRTGVVVEVTESPSYEEEKLKEIAGIDETAVPIEAQLIALAAWIKRSYGGTMNAALKTVLPVHKRAQRKEKEILVLKAASEEAQIALAEYEKKHFHAKARLLKELIEEKRIPKEFVTGKLHVAAPTIRSLAAAGMLTVEKERPDYRNPVKGTALTAGGGKKLLNAEQRAAADRMIGDFRRGEKHTYLLHGVTGSGKTEVYLTLIEEVVAAGKQVIMLIPEIALTYQTVMRFYERFHDRVSILNSKMPAGERYDQYLRAKEREIDIIIGPRSALFTPFPDLGLIILDEEHETSYKSETIPRYHARETAIARAEMSGASVVLGSATPSMESFYRAKEGAYVLLPLTKRVEERPLPACEIIDLRAELMQGNRSIFSRRLVELMEEKLSKEEQIMLFLNRRGMSGFVVCRSCGEAIKCPHCDVSLSLHRDRTMRCHYCGYQIPAAQKCPSCGSPYIGGMKAGTEKVEKLVRKQFPSAKTLRMDLDTTREKDGYEKILTAFSNREADILIGTQMIVKGHDFPNVTLVGILAADLSLNIPDFHGAERTFDLLTQAAGRAGRGELPGNVVIQTYHPGHYGIVNAAGQDYDGFYEQEIAYRRMMQYPPVWHMLNLLVSDKDEQAAADGAKRIAGIIRREFPEIRMVGPADAAIAKVNDYYKKVLYCKDKDYEALIRVKDRIEEAALSDPAFSRLLVRFDFDPADGF
ncbi:MAG: primosomal protein N' [Lachnospiraceae bacterium]|nr:primosomal protein N' [Lachnospiraceae bacterium]